MAVRGPLTAAGKSTAPHPSIAPSVYRARGRIHHCHARHAVGATPRRLSPVGFLSRPHFIFFLVVSAYPMQSNPIQMGATNKATRVPGSSHNMPETVTRNATTIQLTYGAPGMR